MQASYYRDVTNRFSDIRTYNGIYLGPTGNWQGAVNIFDLETGKFKKTCMIVSFPVPDHVIAMVNKWGIKFHKETCIHKIDFLNRHKDKYAWDNYDLDDNEMALVEDNVPRSHITAEMLGVYLAS